MLKHLIGLLISLTIYTSYGSSINTLRTFKSMNLYLITFMAMIAFRSNSIFVEICRYVEIGIISGIPVSINGKELSPASLLSELNEIGGRHGIGRMDMVENRLVGMKSRGVYETPGGTILHAAARELESLTLDRETIQMKDMIALKYAELVYAGRWFDPLRESMDAFMEKITETTTGSVTLKLYKGSVMVASRRSPKSLYREDISSFETGSIYNQADAAGFIQLYGLPIRVRAMLEKGV